MKINISSSPDSLELLPSIMIQRVFGLYFVYISWLTVMISFEPDAEKQRRIVEEIIKKRNEQDKQC